MFNSTVSVIFVLLAVTIVFSAGCGEPAPTVVEYDSEFRDMVEQKQERLNKLTAEKGTPGKGK